MKTERAQRVRGGRREVEGLRAKTKTSVERLRQDVYKAFNKFNKVGEFNSKLWKAVMPSWLHTTPTNLYLTGRYAKQGWLWDSAPGRVAEALTAAVDDARGRAFFGAVGLVF